MSREPQCEQGVCTDFIQHFHFKHQNSSGWRSSGDVRTEGIVPHLDFKNASRSPRSAAIGGLTGLGKITHPNPPHLISGASKQKFIGRGWCAISISRA